MKKITWDDIYKDFKARCPKLCKDVIDYRPYGYLTIIVYFKDGPSMIYDYMTHQGKFERE